MSPKYNTQQLSQLEEKTLKMTSKIVGDAQLLLMLVRQRSATMSDQNKRSAAQYVSDIRDALKESTNVGIQKANQIVLDKIRDVENELTSFGFVIDDSVNSYVKDVGYDIQTIRSKVSRAETGDAAQVLETALSEVEQEIRSLVADIDQMYSHFGGYIIQTVEHFMENASDRISIMLNGQRRSCDCSLSDRISMCYNITSQNDVVYKNLETVAKMINFVQNATDTVADVVGIYSEVDKNYVAKFEKSKDILEKTMDDAKQTINLILENDYNFLGSTMRQFAYEDHSILQEFMVRSMKTIIQSLARRLQTTMDNFEVVKPVEHRTKLVIELEEKLDDLVNEMKSKAFLIADTSQRSEFEQKVNLQELKNLLKTSFANVTHTVNTAFNDNRNRLTAKLKYNLGYIVKQQLPHISSLTLQNYIPSDICPLALDYQKFIMSRLKQVMDKSDSDIIIDLFKSANYFGDDTETGAAMAPYDKYDSLQMPSESVGTPRNKGEVNKETDAIPAIMNLVLAIFSAVDNLGEKTS